MPKELNEVIFLCGKKVNLRPIFRDDLPRITRWINDPDVRYYINAYLPRTVEQEESWLGKMRDDAEHNIVLIIEVKGEAIGLMGLHNIDWINNTATSGALIGEKKYWGKGYGSEAKMLFLNYAFNTLNLRKICSAAIASNERSIKYNTNCGYLVEGTKVRQIYKDGQYLDEVILAVFKEDWLPLWEDYKKKYKLFQKKEK